MSGAAAAPRCSAEAVQAAGGAEVVRRAREKVDDDARLTSYLQLWANSSDSERVKAERARQQKLAEQMLRLSDGTVPADAAGPAEVLPDSQDYFDVLLYNEEDDVEAATVESAALTEATAAEVAAEAAAQAVPPGADPTEPMAAAKAAAHEKVVASQTAVLMKRFSQHRERVRNAEENGTVPRGQVSRVLAGARMAGPNANNPVAQALKQTPVHQNENERVKQVYRTIPRACERGVVNFVVGTGPEQLSSNSARQAVWTSVRGVGKGAFNRTAAVSSSNARLSLRRAAKAAVAAWLGKADCSPDETARRLRRFGESASGENRFSTMLQHGNKGAGRRGFKHYDEGRAHDALQAAAAASNATPPPPGVSPFDPLPIPPVSAAEHAEVMEQRDEAVAARDEAVAARDEAVAARDEAAAARDDAIERHNALFRNLQQAVHGAGDDRGGAAAAAAEPVVVTQLRALVHANAELNVFDGDLE